MEDAIALAETNAAPVADGATPYLSESLRYWRFTWSIAVRIKVVAGMRDSVPARTVALAPVGHITRYMLCMCTCVVGFVNFSPV